MLSVSMYKDISTYKAKLFFGLTTRRLVSLILGGGFAVGTNFACKAAGIPEDIYSWFIIIGFMPIMATGFLKIKGMDFEKYAMLWLRHEFGKHQLPYKAELIIDEMKKSDGETMKKKSKKRGKRKKIRKKEYDDATAKTAKAKRKE